MSDHDREHYIYGWPAGTGQGVDAEISSIVNIDDGTMSGCPCFAGSRVPIHTLFFGVDSGANLEELFESWPTIMQDDARALLRTACRLIIDRKRQLMLAEGGRGTL